MYFIWCNIKEELIEYFIELFGEVVDYMWLSFWLMMYDIFMFYM